MYPIFKGLIDLLTPQLARLFDSFKAASPVIAAVIVSALIGVQYFADSCTFEFCTSEWFGIIKYFLMALLGLVGSRTTRFVEKKTPIEK